MSRFEIRFLRCATALTAPILCLSSAHAAGPTVGFSEPVVQWVTQAGETCASISTAVYGSADHPDLLRRYNKLDCDAPLPEGTTLVVPATVTVLPDAKMRSMSAAVQQKPAGGGWGAASPGMPLFKNHSVNTQDKGRADIEFTDRTRIFLAENTLVVLYGTAARTRVKKNVAAESVELEKGEVKAGLSALRGDSVEVSVKGGGTVKAASRDTVIQRAGERTTVAVFDGKASVSAGGKSVDVPTNFGTRFLGQKPPDPPRPLPPAPPWKPGGSGPIVLAEGSAVLAATWEPVAKAKSYRFEIARDPEFRDLLAREEVPASVQSFRAEGIPPGTYYLLVRAIDDEDYLGIASVKRAVLVVGTKASGGAFLDAGGVDATRYSVLELDAMPDGVAFAQDDGAFGPPPKKVDLGKNHADRLRFRGADGAASEIPIRYHPVQATLTVTRELGRVRVHAALTGADGIDVKGAIRPSLRVRAADGEFGAELSGDGTALDGEFPSRRGAMSIELRDGSGVILGSADVPGEDSGLSPDHPKTPILGIDAPLLSLSSITDVPWTAPTPRDSASTSALGDRKDGKTSLVGMAHVQGAAGRLGIDATIVSNGTDGGRPSDATAWLGARVRTVRLAGSSFENAIGVRAGLPATATGPGARVEPSASFAGAFEHGSWVADVGARLRVDDDGARARAPSAQGFALAGAAYEIAPPVRVYGVLDVHAFGGDGSDVRARGGLTAGVEAGAAVFGGLAARVSPWADLAGPVTVQLSVGVRQP